MEMYPRLTKKTIVKTTENWTPSSQHHHKFTIVIQGTRFGTFALIVNALLLTSNNNRSFGCPMSIHNVILVIDTSTMLDTTKLNCYFG